MRAALSNALATFARWIAPKAAPAAVTNSRAGSGFVDHYRRKREPSSAELVAGLKETAYSCAVINAAVCASYKPKLYVATSKGQAAAKCKTRPVIKSQLPTWAQRLHGKTVVYEEVLEHPALTLLAKVNPRMNGHDLLELTTLYQESDGNAYWKLEFDAFDVPIEIWPLPSQRMKPMADGSFEFRTDTGQPVKYTDAEIVWFKYPNPADPYGPGLSPLRGAYESVCHSSLYLAFRSTIWDNHALPGVMISPKADVISPEERDRIEEEYNQKFRRGGLGRALVAEQGMQVEVLRHQLADLAALAEARATKDDIANAYGVPLPYLTRETNLANLQGARQQHAQLAIWPRTTRRDEKLNEKLLPLFDDSGRLFFCSDSPVPEDQAHTLKQEQSDARYGIQSINEIRAERGLPPAPWGEEPWLPLASAPASFVRPPDSSGDGGDADPESARDDYAPRTGRNRDPEHANTSKAVSGQRSAFSRNGTHP